MKRFIVFVVGALSLFSQHVGAQTLSDATDSASYALGIVMKQSMVELLARIPLVGVDQSKLAEAFSGCTVNEDYLIFIKDQLGDIDKDIMVNAFRASINGQQTLMDEGEATLVLNSRAEAEHNKTLAARKAEADKNAADGASFLAENAKNKDVVTLPSGLQYKILTAGNGPKPQVSSAVKVMYRGSFIDGTEFDASVEPIVFTVGDVIDGWTEALQLMPVGSKWKLYIPSDLAYGERGAGDAIGPNSTLIFEVELVEIVE